MRYVQPALVYAVGLDEVGILGIYRARQARILHILVEVRPHHYDIGAFALCLPHGVARLYAEFFGLFALGKHYALALLLVAAHRNGHADEFGVQFALYRGVEVVEVGMNYYSLHLLPPSGLPRTLKRALPAYFILARPKRYLLKKPLIFMHSFFTSE